MGDKTRRGKKRYICCAWHRLSHVRKGEGMGRDVEMTRKSFVVIVKVGKPRVG